MGDEDQKSGEMSYVIEGSHLRVLRNHHGGRGSKNFENREMCFDISETKTRWKKCPLFVIDTNVRSQKMWKTFSPAALKVPEFQKIWNSWRRVPKILKIAIFWLRNTCSFPIKGNEKVLRNHQGGCLRQKHFDFFLFRYLRNYSKTRWKKLSLF